MNNRLADLKRIEQLALEEIDIASKGYYDEEKSKDITRLQTIARKARIERLELELQKE